jgi:hypothetical protein
MTEVAPDSLTATRYIHSSDSAIPWGQERETKIGNSKAAILPEHRSSAVDENYVQEMTTLVLARLGFTTH